MLLLCKIFYFRSFAKPFPVSRNYKNMKAFLLVFTISFFTFAQNKSEIEELKIENLELKKHLETCNENYAILTDNVNNLIKEIEASNKYINHLIEINRKSDSLNNILISYYKSEIDKHVNKKEMSLYPSYSNDDKQFDCSKNTYKSLGTDTIP